MNAQASVPAQRREPTQIDVLKGHLTRAADEIKSTLPAHISMDKFQRTAVTAALTNPQLLQCDRQSFLMACNKLALDGLLPDGREAALVPFKTSKKVDNQWVEKWLVQAMPMAFGLRKKVLQSGEVLSLQVGVVYRAEVASGNFIYEIGMDPPIRHRPSLDLTEEQMADGELIAAYSIARIKNEGGEPFWSVEVMRRVEVLKVRQMSQTGALGQVVKFGKDKGKPIPPKGPWVDWEPEMWKKTVLRRHTKVLPMSSDLIDTFARDQDEERQADTAAAILSVEPVAPTVLPAERDLGTAMLADNSGDNGVQIDSQTGEILQKDPATGMTVVDEDTARALDAQTLEGGRADHEHGDQHDGAGGDGPVDDTPAYAGWVKQMNERIAAATTPAFLRGIETDLSGAKESLPDGVVADLEKAIGARRAAILKKA